MAFELWSKDEYGQGAIIGRFNDYQKLIAKARLEVNNINVENALAAAEKRHAWEAYFVEILEKGKPSERKVYAGNNPDGKHRVNTIKKSGQVDVDLLTESEQLKIYLGDLDGETWYAVDAKGNEITSLSSREGKMTLEGKTMFFARLIK